MTEQEKMIKGYLWGDDEENMSLYNEHDEEYYFKDGRFDEQPE